MAGVMWRRSMILLMFCAWKACSAEKLVNLVEPQLSRYAPTSMSGGAVNLFDHDKSSYATGSRGAKFKFSPPIRVTKIKITMAAHVPREEYPARIGVTSPGRKSSGGIVFENRVGKVTWYGRCGLCGVNLSDSSRSGKKFDIAEIKLLGPREALDALWSHGKYPCSERLAIITTHKELKKVFSRSKYAIPKKELLDVFNPNARGAGFYYRAARPVIIGAVIPDGLPVVNQVSVVVGRRTGLKELVLEGHKCHPRSDTGKCKGWERLASSATVGHPSYRYRLQVENPGEYKAYRVKFIPWKQEPLQPNGKYINVQGIYFQGCTAQTP